MNTHVSSYNGATSRNHITSLLKISMAPCCLEQSTTSLVQLQGSWTSGPGLASSLTTSFRQTIVLYPFLHLYPTAQHLSSGTFLKIAGICCASAGLLCFCPYGFYSWTIPSLMLDKFLIHLQGTWMLPVFSESYVLPLREATPQVPSTLNIPPI